jgi:hypothetical protein
MIRRAVIAVALLLWLGGVAVAQELPLPVAVSRGGIMVRAEAGMDSLAEKVADSAASTLRDIAEDLRGLPVPSRV